MRIHRAIKHEERDQYCYCNFDSLLEVIIKCEKLSKFRHMYGTTQRGKLKLGWMHKLDFIR
jgi:hypothetical protein